MTSGVVVSLVRLGGLAVWCAACALGQSAQLREPRLGYVFTASEASLRPMVGIPATAVLAAPNPLPGAPASVTSVRQAR